MSLYDYDRWPNFTKEELICSHTGLENPNVAAFTMVMDAIQFVREEMQVPFEVASAYRNPEHPIEIVKAHPGSHCHAAIDIRLDDIGLYHELAFHMFKVGFGGIGWNMKGPHDERFIHGDMRLTKRIWSY